MVVPLKGREWMVRVRIRTFYVIRWMVRLLCVHFGCRKWWCILWKAQCVSCATCLIEHKKEAFTAEWGKLVTVFLWKPRVEMAALGPWHDAGLLRQCHKSLQKLPRQESQKQSTGRVRLKFDLLPALITLLLSNKIRSLQNTSLFSLFMLMLDPLYLWGGGEMGEEKLSIT